LRRGGRKTDAEILHGDTIADLSRLTHWHPTYRRFKTWSDVPQETRELVAERLSIEAQQHEELSSRVRGARPNQTRFEAMWAHLYRLAAAHLFDPSLEVKDEETCRDDDDDERHTDERSEPA